jgi:hypothetical protein
MSKLEEVLKKTDWDLFADQKQNLVDIILYPAVEVHNDKLQGILNWIDSIQDAAVEDGILTENDIFKLKKE